MSETQKCVPCGYESPIKCNFIRHISSKSHCKKCEIPIPEKTVSKKQAALLLAAEQAAKKLAEEQAVVLLAAQQAAAIVAAQEAELNRVKAEAIQAARPKCEMKREREIAAQQAKVADKAGERAAVMAYRINRDKLKAEEKLASDLLKAQARILKVETKEATAKIEKEEDRIARIAGKLEKAKLDLTTYIQRVCDEEVRDVTTFSHAPMTLMLYIGDIHRIGYYLSQYYALVPHDHILFMNKAHADASKKLADQGHEGCAIDDIDTVRGKKHLKRITDFHETFVPRPFMPSRSQLKFIVDDATLLQCFLDESTGRVYDYDVRFCIGKYVSYYVEYAGGKSTRYEVEFNAGQPSEDVLNPKNEE